MDNLLSIIIPAYNCEKYIERCINSIFLSEVIYEVIVVDDGSSDATGIIVEDLCKKYNDLRVFHIENSGATKARYFGTEHAKGKYVSYVDADDYVLASGYRELLEEAVKNDADIVTSGMRIIHLGKEHDEFDSFAEGLYEKGPKEELMKSCLFDIKGKRAGFICSCCNKLFKRELILLEFKKVSVRLKAWEDIQYLFGAFETAERILISKKVFYIYDQREDSTTHWLRLSELIYSYKVLIASYKNSISNFEQQMRWVFHIVVYSTYLELVRASTLREWKESSFCKELKAFFNTDFFKESFSMVKEEGFFRNNHMKFGIPIVKKSVIGGWFFERLYYLFKS